jgi:hypothetical protein
MSDRCMRVIARNVTDVAGVSRYGTLSDAQLRFQKIVDGLRIGLAA